MKQKGFTLVEIVLAIMLLGIMMLLLYSGLTFALRGWDSAGTRGQLVTDRRLGENFLRREVMEVFPMRWTDPFVYKIAFSGEAKRLRFVSSRPPGATLGGLALVSVEMETDPRTHHGRLVMRRAMPDEAANDFSPLDHVDERTVLVEDVADASFSYFGAETEFAEPKWEDNWTFQKLPFLVRLRLTGTDGVPLPEMILRVALGEEAGCLENAFQRVCRARRANP